MVDLLPFFAGVVISIGKRDPVGVAGALDHLAVNALRELGHRAADALLGALFHHLPGRRVVPDEALNERLACAAAEEQNAVCLVSVVIEWREEIGAVDEPGLAIIVAVVVFGRDLNAVAGPGVSRPHHNEDPCRHQNHDGRNRCNDRIGIELIAK